MTRKNNWAKFVVAVMLCLPLSACKDTRTLQENEQLKAQVAELQKENTQAASDLASMTAARDALTKENDALKAQLAGRKSKHSGTKSGSRRHRRSKTSSQ
jgi:septal ring factor EnvC (AmiA/AmiB activator)